ncbi:AAA family ATPase [Paracoccus sp. KR1-242]|uniref:AAA family ATPase n=1 Tax=Paracoccus sp. KR1-242 TaxID=3410028 RepID=UPI003C0040D3
MAAERDKFSHHARAVALELLGEPNKQLSSQHELRFGKAGSVSVDLEKGAFFNHEQKEGGGVLWFIQQQTGAAVEGGAAVQWLRDHGYYVEDDGMQQRQADRPSQRLDPKGNWLPQRVPDHGRLTATYDYRDARGDVAYQVCRFDWTVDPEVNPKGHEKTFVQRRPDRSKKDGWTYKTQGMTALPYRLPELLDDLADGRTVFVVEGEKKVDMLRDLGVPATCNHGGAGKWPSELTEHFRGADVVILPDNDPQSTLPDGSLKNHPDGRPVFPGQDHANLVGRNLSDVARRVRTLEIPGLPLKGGVDDWIPAGGDAEQLYDLVDAVAKPFEAAPFTSRFGAVEWLNFDAPGAKHEYLIKGVLTRNELSFLLGESQSGKSFIAIDMAMAVARGVEWFGHKVRRGGVIYQAGESAAGVRRRRFPAYRQRFECSGSPLSVVLLEKPVDFYNSDEEVDAFIEECLHWKRTFRDPLELIVIDTFNKATPGANENDGKDMGVVLERCDRVKRATGAHVMLVHHLNAGGTKARGHTSLFANVDNVVTVRRCPDRTDDDNRQVREWVLSKQKDGEDGVNGKFVLPSIVIGKDEDGDDITSCTVSAPSTRPGAVEPDDPSGITISPSHSVFLRVIYDAISAKGTLAPVDLGLSRGAMAVDRVDLWNRVREVYEDDPEDQNPGETPEEAAKRRAANLRQQIKRSRDHLYQKGVLDTKDNWFWLTGKNVKGFEEAPGLGDAAKRRRSRKKPDAVPSDESFTPSNLPFNPEDFG